MSFTCGLVKLGNLSKYDGNAHQNTFKYNILIPKLDEAGENKIAPKQYTGAIIFARLRIA